LARKVSCADVEILHEELEEGATSKYYDRIRLPQELRELVQSSEKASQLLGWEPKVELEAGLREEYMWLGEHPERWHTMNY
jgi:nucleoside-diphosphate-sugar epimerase